MKMRDSSIYEIMELVFLFFYYNSSIKTIFITKKKSCSTLSLSNKKLLLSQ